MQKLYELINFNINTWEGRLQHVSSYHRSYSDVEENYVFYHEDFDGCVRTAKVTPSEYWTKLKANPLLLKDQGTYALFMLSEVIGENSDLIYLQTDYCLSLGNICYYLLYNFEYIKATLHIETLKVTVQKKDSFDKMFNYKIPKMDYLSLVALVMESFKQEELGEFTKLHCTKCNHTYYALGQLDRDSDICIYCKSSDDVEIVQDYKVNLHVG
jgi:hypothetical protein